MLPAYGSQVGAIALQIRRVLEGTGDAFGHSQPGDLERRLRGIGLLRDAPAAEPPNLAPEDRFARQVIDAFVQSRMEAGLDRTAATGQFISEAAYAWTNRLLALRCMEARGLIEEGIVQKAPAAGEDEGLFARLFGEFERLFAELPMPFNPSAQEMALRPSVEALKRCLAILSGAEPVRAAGPASAGIWTAPDALGWAYQHWHGEHKDRIFETLRTRKGEKIGGGDLIPATCVYTQPYIVRFLVQNSLGALWMGMHPASRLCETWEYFVKDADLRAVQRKSAGELSFLDPACGSGHFLLEAFDLLYAMYLEEGKLTDPQEICASIFENNLYGMDIDERAVQVAAFSLLMKAKEKAPGFAPRRVHLVATNLRLAAGDEQIEAYLRKHPEDAPRKPALLSLFRALQHVDELGALAQIETPVDPDVLDRLQKHFGEAARAEDPAGALFGQAATRGLSLLDLLSRRYDVISMNPPYIGFRKLASHIKEIITADALAKLDIYVAFLSRFFSLLADGGSLAAVCPSSWTTSSSTLPLRQKMMNEGGPRIVAALGQRVFEPAPLLFVSLQVIEKGPRRPDAYLVTLRPAPLSGPEGLARVARQGAKIWPHTTLRSLETLPFLPIAPRELLEKAPHQPTVGEFFSFVDGIWTGSNERDIREGWEVDPGDPAWMATSGGQGYARWYAPTSRRIRSRHARAWPARDARSFALEYARVAGGKLSARLVRSESTAIAGVVSLLPGKGTDPRRLFETAVVFNSRLGTVWLRTLTSGLNFNPGYAGRIPLAPNPPPDELERAVDRVVLTKQALAQREITSDDFIPSLFEQAHDESLAARAERFCRRSFDLIARALEEENQIELLLKEHLGISAEAWREIELEMGEPAASLPEQPPVFTAPQTASGNPGEGDEEDFVRALPAESDLEQLSRSCRVHPKTLLSAGDLPRPLGEAFGGICAKRKLTFVADYLSLIVLRLFGHRFPAEAAPDAPLERAIDGGEIIPLTALPGERSLFDRLSDSLAGGPNTSAEGAHVREIAEILGKPLDRWIESELFRYHIARFIKRPILWQLQSGKYSTTKKPALSVLVYARGLSASTLPRIRTHHVASRQALLSEELRRIESLAPARRISRKKAIEAALEELRAFDTRLDEVIRSGFACRSLKTILANEPLDRWTSPDGGSPAASSVEELASWEERYAPVPGDGIRVHVAPLQRAGLLAAEVLPPKDMDRAIEDRAEWRAEERALCRNGKLPKPGFWP